jgi:ABC-type iron transport system FetAB ATPase subunit
MPIEVMDRVETVVIPEVPRAGSDMAVAYQHPAVDIHVDAGEIVALLGPNRAGETTTLLTVSGLVPVNDGSVIVLGEEVNSRSPHENARRGSHMCQRTGRLVSSFGANQSSSRRGHPRRADRGRAPRPHRGLHHDIGRRHFSYEVLGERLGDLVAA